MLADGKISGDLEDIELQLLKDRTVWHKADFVRGFYFSVQPQQETNLAAPRFSSSHLLQPGCGETKSACFLLKREVVDDRR